MFEEGNADYTVLKNGANADVENRSLIRVFKEVTVDQKVTVDLGSCSAAREPLKTLSNQTNRVSKQVPLKHAATDARVLAVEQCTRCSDTMPDSSRRLDEFITEAETEIGRLSHGLSASELRRVHSRVFCRR